MSFAEKITGAHVDLVSFGVAHFQLVLTKGQQSFTVSSSADVSFNSDDKQTDFRDLKAPSGLTALIGKRLVAIEHSEDCRFGTLQFEEGNAVYANWPDAICDNLFVVRFEGSDEWTVIG